MRLPVVMLYGVGGAGKSWLLCRLRADLSAVIPSALIDVDPYCGGGPYHTDYLRAPAELRPRWAAITNDRSTHLRHCIGQGGNGGKPGKSV